MFLFINDGVYHFHLKQQDNQAFFKLWRYPVFPLRIIAKTRILPVLLATLIIGGCGQKGALYLPDDEAGEAAAQCVHGTFLV